MRSLFNRSIIERWMIGWMTVSNGLERTLKIVIVAYDWRDWRKPRKCQDSKCTGRVSNWVPLEWSQKCCCLNELFRLASPSFTSYLINISWRIRLIKRFYYVFFSGRRLWSVSWTKLLSSVFYSQQKLWRIRTNQDLQEIKKIDIIANTKQKKRNG